MLNFVIMTSGRSSKSFARVGVGLTFSPSFKQSKNKQKKRGSDTDTSEHHCIHHGDILYNSFAFSLYTQQTNTQYTLYY